MQYTQPIGAAANAPYVDANPGAGIEGSAVPAASIEAPQREIVAVIQAAGLAPSGADLGQLSKAIYEIVQRQVGNYAIDTGTPNHFVVALAGDVVAAPVDGQPIRIRTPNAVTGASDVDIGTGQITLVRSDGTAIQAGDIPANSIFTAAYQAAANKWYMTSTPLFNASSLGQAAFKAVSDNTKTKVSSINGATVVGHIATFSDVNGTVQDGGAVPVGISGGSVERLIIVNNGTTPNTKIDVTVGPICLVDTAGKPIFAGGYSNTIDLTTNGVNGMDAGARPTSGWVYVYAICDGVNFRFLASTSATSPTMPGAYTFRKYLGAMFCDGSQNLRRSKQLGRWAQYTQSYRVATGQSGALTSTTVTWVAVSIASFAPPTAGEAVAQLQGEGGTGVLAIAPNNSYSGYATSTPPPYYTSDNGPSGQMAGGPLLLESTNVYGAQNAGTFAIYIIGWTDTFV